MAERRESSTATDGQPDLAWRKSTASGGGGNEGSCIEMAAVNDRAMVRDSKNREGLPLSFSRDAWTMFLGGVANGSLGVS